jgi:predicted anti-sigma-YlaC factor YlaD
MSLWIDDQLTEDEVRQIEAHATHCVSCRAALDDLRRLDRLLSAAPMISPAPGFTERFQTRLATRHRRRRTWAGLLTLAIATIALFLGVTLFLVISGLTLWEDLPASSLLAQVTGLLLDLGEAIATSLRVAWLVVSALAQVVRHPVSIAYFAATAVLIAVWTQIVTRRTLVHHPVRASLNT